MSTKSVADIYMLSPVQLDVLESIINAENFDFGCRQFSCELKGSLDILLFEKAWQKLVDSYSVLRSCFAWKRTDKPLQVVSQESKFSLVQYNWQGLSATERESEWEILLEAEKSRSFDPSKVPLFQVTLCCYGANDYRLICSYSRLLMDEVSFNLLLKEFFICYMALCKGEDWQDSKTSQYKNYINWFRQQDLSISENFWRKALENFVVPTLLPCSLQYSADSNKYPVCSTSKLQLSEIATNKLQDLAIEQKLNLQSFLQGAWAILLSRYCQEENVVFGVAVSGRTQALKDNELMIGSFANTLPVKVYVSQDIKILDWLKKVEQQLNDIYQHGFNSQQQILDWCHISHDIPLFESVIIWDNDLIDNLSQTEFTGFNINKIRQFSKEIPPIAIKAEWGDSLTLQINYNPQRFDDKTISQILKHLEKLLLNIALQSEKTLSQLSLLTDLEEQKLLWDWNNTETKYTKSQCIHQLFEAKVAETPSATAVIFQDKHFTYEQLNRQANQLAYYLQSLGVGPEVLVGISVERSYEAIVGLLGILKAGGVYVPLDPTYPIERLSFMLENAQPSVLLTQELLLEKLPSTWAQVVCLDSDWDAIIAESSQENLDSNLDSGVTPNNLAYIIYTSGSTGTPKGVLLEHQGLCNLAEAQQKMFDLEPNSRVLQFASLSFDASIWEIVMALCSGATLCMGTPEELRPGENLMQTLQKQSISHVTLPPTALAALPSNKLPQLQTLIVAGEACNPELMAQWSKGRRFFNAYGPTESTVCATVAECTSSDKQLSIGRPISNTQIYILDNNLQPVPVGIPGSLYIGGICLARGYLHRPDLTEEKFIPNPFSESKLSRIYKTGDLARYLSNGDIEYIGRSDNQAKIRGFRIELGEIEAILAQHSKVREAAVIVREDQPGNKQLVAYFSVNATETKTITFCELKEEIRKFLKQKLPEYMIPSAFVMLEVMPLTPNGKIDRKALLEPDLELTSSVAFVPPSTSSQQTIANIFLEVLQVKQVGIFDNFFELGGHSLNATQVVSRLQMEFGVELQIRHLFESPTVSELDKCISNLRESDNENNNKFIIAPIEAVARDTNNLPLSWAQTRLWFIEQFEGANAAYNIPVAAKITGNLNINILEKSLKEIVRRHEVLRTSYHTVNGQATQVISPDATVILPVINLESLSENEQSNVIQHISLKEAQLPFNLANAPLVRVQLLQLRKDNYVLLLTMHHIISDAWSMGVFIRELSTLYSALADNANQKQPNNILPELLIQYADFAVWQNKWLREQVLEKQLEYWKKQLVDAPPLLELPTDRPRSPIRTFNGRSLEFSLGSTLTEKLNNLSQNYGTTLFMTLMTAFKTLLWRYTHQDDILIGTPVGNRNRQETESLIGLFVNTLVLRTQIQDNPSFAQLLKQVQQITLKAYEHQDIPFEQVIEALQLPRNLSNSPLFQVMFVLQNAPIGELQLPGLTLSIMPVEITTSKFDLTLSMTETSQGLVATWEHNKDLFDEETIVRMARHFQTLLEAIVTNPQQPISKLALLSNEQIEQFAVLNKSQELSLTKDQCIHHLFAEQVERTPDAVALVLDDTQITYQELNARANKIARHLQSLGVGTEVLVGLCVERSLEMISGLLGILKAGGAYVPLDPTYPQERLSFMLQDSGISVLLTQQHLIEVLPENQAQIVCLDRDWESIAQEREENLPIISTVDNLAYIIYTSGSTGQPKGTLISHGNVVRLLKATEPWYNFNEQDVWSLFHSYAFDFSVWEIWGSLLYGGRLVIIPHLLSRSPEDFYKMLSKQQITVLNQTPSAFRQLINAEESLGKYNSLNLRLVIFGGEALDIQYLKPWFDRHGDQFPQLVNMYGITETTVHVTYSPLTIKDLEIKSRNIIGHPIPDLQVYILDRYQQPVPIGVSGEIYVGGNGLARGYLNRPEMTASKFIPNFLSQNTTNNSENRLYRSGDLGRYLSSGELEYLGRIDNQVKIRGFRIELGEIENNLVQHQAVREAVVLALPTCNDDNQLVAYITSHSVALTVDELRKHLLERLPDYMVPSTFIFIEELPLTPNGKVNYRVLPKPDATRPGLEVIFVAPRTNEEKILATIWAKVLELEQVGINDNFFALGGDSIRSIQVQSLARGQGLNFSVQQLFQYQTIEQLAESIVNNLINNSYQQQTKTNENHQIQPFELICEEDKKKLLSNIEDAYPLVMLQTGMLFHSDYNSDTAIYHDIVSYCLKANLDLDIFRKAIEKVVHQHPVLRTSFNLSDYSEPLQLVHKHVEIPLHIQDISHLSNSQQEETLNTWFTTEKNQRFNWTQAPILRLNIHKLTNETFQFTVCCHHAILDGWSMASMNTQLLKTYLELLNREIINKEIIDEETTKIEPSIKSHFRNFVALEKEAIASEISQRYWYDKLSDSLYTALPRKQTITQEQASQKIGIYQVKISSNISQKLNKLARSLGVNLKSLLLAAHIRVLSLLSGQSDVVTGLVSNGRPEETDGEKALGLFLNTLPLRQQLQDVSWIDLIKNTFALEQEMIPHRRYPIAELQKLMGRKSLFETAFNFVNFHIFNSISNIKEFEVLNVKSESATHFTLLAQFHQEPSTSRLNLQLEYDITAFDEEQLQFISSYYLKTLIAIAEEPEKSYQSCVMLSTEEENKILHEWNNTQVEYPHNPYIHQLFESQVKLSPNAIAVKLNEQSITYWELNKRANQLAQYLKSLGVKPGVLVGICVERSFSMIIGILAILKAGGAYVPLDSSYPQERLAYILNDSQPSVLLTQSQFTEKFPHHNKIVCLDKDSQIIYPQNTKTPSENLAINNLNPENLVYVIYTSGSTGEPKGVPLSHNSLSNLIQWQNNQTHQQNKTNPKTLQFSPISFDVSFQEIFSTLCIGGTLILVTEQVRRDAIALLELIVTQSVERIFMPFIGLQQLAEAAVSNLEYLPENLLTKLHTIIVAGEQLQITPAITEFLKKLPNCTLQNQYGPSESHVVTSYTLKHPIENCSTLPPIGRPIANTQIYILDSNLKAVPTGVPGELHIGGICLSNGYRNRPDLTKEKFIPNPFKNSKWNRLYKTGDLARYLPDGNIQFLGRVDNQVKVRGFRVELQEIEAILSQHPQISQAAVTVYGNEASEKRLMAYIVLNQNISNQELTIKSEELWNFLQQKLPEYMIPSGFIKLDALPLTPSGKVNRRALPTLEANRLMPSQTYIAPSTPLEEALVKMWMETLNIEKIGTNDNFFLLGGNSLIATQLISRIRQTFDLQINVASLFEHPTIAEIAEKINNISNREIINEIATTFLQIDNLSPEEIASLLN